MKNFLISVLVFSGLLTSSILAVFLMADGRSDSYYARFTTPAQHSLIIGTSRAAQGIQPAVLDTMIYKGTAHHFFNYSFSLFDSPFGPAYLQSIERKLDPRVTDGIFIVAVDPWMLCAKNEDPNDSLHFWERNSFMGNTKKVNCNPNIPYLVESYSEPYINIIRKRTGAADLILHKDGWLEVIVSMDSTLVAQRLQAKLEDYNKNYLPVYKFSSVRFSYLKQTISFLQNHGKVYLVRLPAHRKIMEMEDRLLPGFEQKIEEVAAGFKVDYLSFAAKNADYDYVDGNHLYKASGKILSHQLARWITEKK
ncbi:MAG: hypothetical protein IPL84_15615 [Chitinophagaceae bacterium]|nr:hypothetical protein [Chitinophagaceae bacterium]